MTAHRPLRVLHLLNFAKDVGCGIVNAAVDIISGQLQQDMTIAVCSKSGAGLAEQLAEHGVRHYTLDQSRSLGNLPRAVLGLRRVIKDFQPDIVHCHMMTGVVLARAVRVTTSFGLVSHLHNIHQRTSNFMRLADRVIAVSQAVADDTLARGFDPRKIRVIHNAPLGSLRLPPPETVAAQPLLQPAIVTVCGMNHRKGLAELIAAFASLAETRPDCHLYLVGDGPQRAEFEAQAQATAVVDRIHFEGFRADQLSYMKAAQVFVLASRRDSFGLVLTEARQCGCAIVATAVDGIPEALDHGRAGILVPAQDVPALAAALAGLLDDPAARAHWGRQALTNLEPYTVGVMAAQLSEIYRELLNLPGPATTLLSSQTVAPRATSPDGRTSI